MTIKETKPVWIQIDIIRRTCNCWSVSSLSVTQMWLIVARLCHPCSCECSYMFRIIQNFHYGFCWTKYMYNVHIYYVFSYSSIHSYLQHKTHTHTNIYTSNCPPEIVRENRGNQIFNQSSHKSIRVFTLMWRDAVCCECQHFTLSRQHSIFSCSMTPRCVKLISSLSDAMKRILTLIIHIWWYISNAVAQLIQD